MKNHTAPAGSPPETGWSTPQGGRGWIKVPAFRYLFFVLIHPLRRYAPRRPCLRGTVGWRGGHKGYILSLGFDNFANLSTYSFWIFEHILVLIPKCHDAMLFMQVCISYLVVLITIGIIVTITI